MESILPVECTEIVQMWSVHGSYDILFTRKIFIHCRVLKKKLINVNNEKALDSILRMLECDFKVARRGVFLFILVKACTRLW